MRKGFEAALAIAIDDARGRLLAYAQPGTASAQGSATAEGSATAQALAVLEAKITPTQGNTCQGTVQFEAQKDGSVKVTADLNGLDANTEHGIHVHETGDCSAPDAMSAGGHYNPTQQPHGLPPAEDAPRRRPRQPDLGREGQRALRDHGDEHLAVGHGEQRAGPRGDRPREARRRRAADGQRRRPRRLRGYFRS